ncbi:hypothetical protein PCASD_13819 [Puccinia coronata f. sp. avenae]|uniref:Uncharacterized protein n=1 Tax=Puccinia coronata f. sp. avenae TaxID=200324 RepID=A0A2N5U5U0_9BASI|nr:hypothetical protein PCASD_13819 [Puccinia coronata f. sp. avenae]
MRVSCIFVSLAVMLAQQASAAPVIGLPALPLLDGEGRLVNGLSDTLGPIPIAGPLVGDLLESKSRGGLLSTLDVTGKYGLINDHGFASDLGRSLFNRRDEVPIAGPILDKFPIMNQILSAIPFDAIHGLDLIESLPGVSKVESIEREIPIPNLGKRDGGIPFLNRIFEQLPGLSQLESLLPMDSSSDLDDAIETIPVVRAFESLKGAIPIPHFGKRSGGVPIISPLLDQLPGGKQTEAMLSLDTILPGLDAIESLPGVDVVESIERTNIAAPHFIKRSEDLSVLGGIPSLGSMGGKKGIPGVPALSGLGALPSLPAMSSIPSMTSLPFAPLVGGMSHLPSLGSMGSKLSIPLIPVLDSIPEIPGITGLTSAGALSHLPSIGSMGSKQSVPSFPKLGSILQIPSTKSIPGIPSISGMSGLTVAPRLSKLATML